MPSQFSAIGFNVRSGDDLAALASRAAERADTLDAAGGQYLRWAPPTGEQLWLQLTKSGDAMGMNPHFAGRSRVRIAIEARVARKAHTPLDGTFLAWANPPDGRSTGGDYPFAFDCPDAARHRALPLPAVVHAQIAAFAQQVTIYRSQADYEATQAAQGQMFPSRSFIPSGILSPEGLPIDPPEPHALFIGHVVDAGERRNSLSGQSFHWVLVDTLGGTFDVVIDPDLLAERPAPGQILSGWFWLSGRILGEHEAARGWLHRLTRR